MSISEVKQLTVLKYAHLFEGIYKFHYIGWWPRNDSFDQSFPFDIFNNIHHLLLENFHGISTLKSAPRNIVKLELINCGFSRFEDLNPTNTLKELTIASQTDLQILCSLDGILTLKFQSIRNIELLFPHNFINFELNCGRFSKLLTTDFQFAISNEKFKMTYNFPIGFTRFTEFQSYPVISLSNRDYYTFPSLPLFFGWDLTFHGFCLAHWNHMTLENVRKLQLLYCTSLIDLPEMPKLEVLSLHRCLECKMAPVLQSLLSLTVQS
jgi:hypothetical protein